MPLDPADTGHVTGTMLRPIRLPFSCGEVAGGRRRLSPQGAEGQRRPRPRRARPPRVEADRQGPHRPRRRPAQDRAEAPARSGRTSSARRPPRTTCSSSPTRPRPTSRSTASWRKCRRCTATCTRSRTTSARSATCSPPPSRRSPSPRRGTRRSSRRCRPTRARPGRRTSEAESQGPAVAVSARDALIRFPRGCLPLLCFVPSAFCLFRKSEGRRQKNPRNRPSRRTDSPAWVILAILARPESRLRRRAGPRQSVGTRRDAPALGSPGRAAGLADRPADRGPADARRAALPSAAVGC